MTNENTAFGTQILKEEANRTRICDTIERTGW